MKQLLSVSANMHEPAIVKNVVEKLASRHIDMGFSNAAIPSQWNAIVSSCIQATVSGNFDINGKAVNDDEMPFDSCFLFTCIKEKNGSFNLEWSTSLS